MHGVEFVFQILYLIFIVSSNASIYVAVWSQFSKNIINTRKRS